MPKNKEKIERNKIREKYAREFAGKLRQKDETIWKLIAKNDELRAQVRRMEEKSALDQVTIQRLDELVETLQAWTEVSDSELEKLKADLARRDSIMKEAARLDGMLSGMQKAFGATLSGYGIQSAVYDLLGGGTAAGLFSGKE